MLNMNSYIGFFKPFSSRYEYLNYSKRFFINCNNSFYYCKSSALLVNGGIRKGLRRLPQTYQMTRGFRYRRPIGIVHPEFDGKVLDDYIAESNQQAALVEDDETDFNSTRSVRKKARKHLSPNKSTSNNWSIGDKIKPLEIENSRAEADNEKEKVIEGDDRRVYVENQSAIEMLKDVRLKNLNIQLYERTKPFIKKLFQNSKSPKTRSKNDVFVIEGWRTVSEALKLELKPHALFFSRSRLLLNMKSILNLNQEELVHFLNMFPLVKTSYSTFKVWSSLVTPPGIVGAFPLSSAMELVSEPNSTSFPLTVILDGIKDPNNLGSILRTLAAANVRKILLMKGCCDPWDTKVMRSASGAHFKAHFIDKVHWRNINAHISSSSPIYLAESSSNFDNFDNLDDKSIINDNLDDKSIVNDNLDDKSIINDNLDDISIINDASVESRRALGDNFDDKSIINDTNLKSRISLGDNFDNLNDKFIISDRNISDDNSAEGKDIADNINDNINDNFNDIINDNFNDDLTSSKVYEIDESGHKIDFMYDNPEHLASFRNYHLETYHYDQIFYYDKKNYDKKGDSKSFYDKNGDSKRFYDENGDSSKRFYDKNGDSSKRFYDKNGDSKRFYDENNDQKCDSTSYDKKNDKKSRRNENYDEKNNDKKGDNASCDQKNRHSEKYDEKNNDDDHNNTTSHYDANDDVNMTPILVIGGELGLSDCALKFACENDGIKVSIPMQEGVDSLNASVACGIIVFEIKKQFRNKIERNKIDN